MLLKGIINSINYTNSLWIKHSNSEIDQLLQLIGNRFQGKPFMQTLKIIIVITLDRKNKTSPHIFIIIFVFQPYFRIKYYFVVNYNKYYHTKFTRANKLDARN